jgi:predicted CopG family antitoxin
MYMSKNVMLSDEAYATLLKQKKANESFSDVVKRLVPPPIRTFGDLEKHLDNLEGPLNLDFEALERIRSRKRRANRAD